MQCGSRRGGWCLKVVGEKTAWRAQRHRGAVDSLQVNDNGIHINEMNVRSQNKQSQLVVLSSPEEERLDAWLQVIRTVTLLEREISSVLSVHEISLPQFDVLATLRFSNDLTQQELASRLLVTKGNICGLLDRLERAGMVARRADPVDSRVNRVRLTASGRRKVDRVIPDHNDTVLKLFEPLTASHIRQVRGLFATLEERVNSL